MQFDTNLCRRIQAIIKVRPVDQVDKRFEEKINELSQLREAIAAPSFEYKETGHKSALSITVGRRSLLELWSFALQYFDIVPSRSGARILLFDIAYYIARRFEFLYPINRNQQEFVEYVKLLQQSLEYVCKSFKRSVIPDDHMILASNLLALVAFRFKQYLEPVMDAVAKATRVIRYPAQTARGNQVQDQFKYLSPSLLGAEKRYQSRIERYQSPKHVDRMWFRRFYDGTSDIDDLEGNLDAYILERQRHIADLMEDQVPKRIYIRSCAEETLEYTFQHGIHQQASLQPDFFIQMTASFRFIADLELYLVKIQALKDNGMESAVNTIIQKLESPVGRAKLILTFLPAVLDLLRFYGIGPEKDSKAVVWHCLPSYFTFVRAFVALFQSCCVYSNKGERKSTADSSKLIQVKAQWTTKEHELIQEGAIALLENGNLLNVLTQIVLENINVYDPQSVTFGLETLSTLFPAASPHQKDTGRWAIPHTFDVDYFVNAFAVLMRSSHLHILVKSIVFLYSIIDLFEGQDRQRIVSKLVLHETFFTLFLHWSHEVRHVFHHILVYKLFRCSRWALPCLSDQVLVRPAQVLEPDLSSNGGFLARASELLSLSFDFATAHAMDEEVSDNSSASAYDRLCAWNDRSSSSESPGRRNSMFGVSLDDTEVSLDISFASKLDTLLKSIVPSANVSLYDAHLNAYAPRGVEEYTDLLIQYYLETRENWRNPAVAPMLEYNPKI